MGLLGTRGEPAPAAAPVIGACENYSNLGKIRAQKILVLVHIFCVVVATCLAWHMHGNGLARLLQGGFLTLTFHTRSRTTARVTFNTC